jgi:hypothetical protein
MANQETVFMIHLQFATRVSMILDLLFYHRVNLVPQDNLTAIHNQHFYLLC